MSDKPQDVAQPPLDAAALRQRAEAQARATTSPAPSAQTPEEIQQMLHELRVHQIELEMQNEELRTAQVAIEAVRARHFDLYDLAPVGYCSVSEKGLILEANLTAATLLGTARRALVKQALSRHILEEDQGSYYRLHKQLLATGKAQECDLRLIKPDGAFFWAHLTSTAAQAEDGAPVCRIVFSDITVRKKAEQQIAELNRDFVAFLENTTDFIYFKDKSSRFRFCSQTLANITGHAHWRDMVGKHDLEVFPAETAQIYYEEELPIFREGLPLLNKIDPYFDASGNKRWVSTSKWPLLDQEGAVAGLFGISRDITEHQSAETALLHEKQFSEDTLNALPGVFYMFDADGRFVRWNHQFREVTGYTDAELATMRGPDFFAGDDQRRVDEAMQRVFADGRSEVEAAFQTKDGRLLPYHLQGQRRSVGGQSYLLGIGTDITVRKQAEEALRLAANVFTHAREGITITDRDANILDVNAAFTDITGYSREEVLGKNPRILNSGKQDKAFYAAMWHTLLTKGHWYGEMWNRRKDGGMVAVMMAISAMRDERGEIQNYIALFSDITTIKEHQAQLEYIAHYDTLTGLPNRLLLGDRLRQAMSQAPRRGQRLAVAYLDLDGFKTVNDTHGHEVGDQLLATLAKRMTQALRNGDTLGRLGGDEFVAVLVDLSDVQASVPILTRLLGAAAQPFPVGDIVLNVSASVGVTFYPQNEAVDADQLLRQADQAMYQAKQAGKNRYHAFDAEQDRHVRGHHESLEHIRQALSDRQFVLFYQPKVNMRTGVVIGAEALIRWQHPQRGLLLPAEFLPVIENHPLAIDLGEWVIDTALAQIEAWRAGGLPIPVSVNVGALQLQHPDFVSCLRMLLARHPGFNPGELELEVLETSALADYSGVSQVMTACQALGVGFALDDFGTGYSSLTYLKQLPAGLLKIDQSFVRDMLDDPDDLAILEGVLGLATAFRRQVIAEGVETLAHGEMLLRLGCEWAQGYAIARPMPANEFQGWVNAWDAPPTWKALNPISKDRLQVLFAAVEHRAWISEMADYLSGNRDTPPERDVHQCRFGHWLDHGGRALLLDEGADQFVDALHREIHCLAAELMALKRAGRLDEVQARISELHRLRDQLLEQLSESY